MTFRRKALAQATIIYPKSINFDEQISLNENVYNNLVSFEYNPPAS